MTPAIPPAAAPTKLMTADEFWDYCRRPENENRYLELVRGEVVEVPRPTKPHGVVATNVAFELKLYVRRCRRGYVASNDSGVILHEAPDTVVGPDVAYYTDANSFGELHPKWGEGPPVLAVEILSPNDKMSKVNAKIRDYLRNDVRLVWLVDYEERKVSVYRPDRTLEVFDETAELTGGDDLPGFSCRVADLFQTDGPEPAVSAGA